MLATSTGISALIAFAVTTSLGLCVIPFLRKLKFGQSILEDGPTWHKSKQGTPTMGGIMTIAGVAAGVLAAYFISRMAWPQVMDGETTVQKVRFWGGILMALGFGCVGFLDDYIKVVKKRNLGLTSRQKMLLQLLVAGAFAAALYFAGDRGMYIPFVGQIDFGIWYIPIIMFIVVGAVNAVNLTDGLDGLASSVTFFVGVCFMLIAGLLQMMGVSMMGAALAGACLGFLIWNFYPARVFMGDTGSLFLGGMVCALAFGVGMPLLLIPAGIVYIIETLSDILQVSYFKMTGGKRLFKMAPFHHHLEMCGYSEIRINALFSILTAIGCILAIVCVLLGGR